MRQAVVFSTLLGVMTLVTLLAGCFFNRLPSASFTLSPDEGGSPLQVSFDASSSSDPDGYIVSYKWDFGDGTTGEGQKITHTFTATITDRTFTVTLTVKDDGGKEDQDSKTVLVKGSPTPPLPPP